MQDNINFILNNDSEKALIGCIILNNILIYKAYNLISPRDFIDTMASCLYELLIDLIINNKRNNVDLVIIADIIKVKKRNDININYAVACCEHVVSLSMFDQYLIQTKENFTKKKYISFLFNCNKEINSVTSNFSKWLGNKESEFREIINYYRKDIIDEVSSPKDFGEKCISRYKFYKDVPNHIKGVKTGFHYLDQCIKGLRTLNVLAATTGGGKTTFALNLATNIALVQNIPILYINYEMEIEDIQTKIISMITNIPSARIEAGEYYNDEEWPSIENSLNAIKETSTFFITNSSPKTINSTLSLIYQYKQDHDIKVVFIDYIGEIDPDEQANKEKNEYITYGRYAQELKGICSKLNIKCVLLSQLNREGDNTMPKRTHIQGSWKLLQKADIGLLLYEKEVRSKQYILNIMKQRFGLYPIKLNFSFNKNVHSFMELDIKQDVN